MDLSVIVPTYKEAENLPHLIAELEKVKEAHGLDMELLIMDDDSHDGTEKLIHQLHKPWIRLIVRKENRGLSPAVLDGFKHARNETLVVMDADLSHPPHAIPAMVQALDQGHDFVLGSRYVQEASTDAEWSLFRKLNSRVATWFAAPLTSVHDPMSGFFALTRETLGQAKSLNPIGYKIALELLVKCHCQRVKEIPIHFADRQRGHSKLTLKQQLQYLQHLRRLFIYKYAESSCVAQYALVGLSGVGVNLAVFTLLLWAQMTPLLALAAAISTSLVTNFFLNRRFTFSYARNQPLARQFFGFLAACSFGAVVNYLCASSLLEFSSFFASCPQLAALIGISLGTVFNYLFNRCWVFQT